MNNQEPQCVEIFFDGAFSMREQRHEIKKAPSERNSTHLWFLIHKITCTIFGVTSYKVSNIITICILTVYLRRMLLPFTFFVSILKQNTKIRIAKFTEALRESWEILLIGFVFTVLWSTIYIKIHAMSVCLYVLFLTPLGSVHKLCCLSRGEGGQKLPILQ